MDKSNIIMQELNWVDVEKEPSRAANRIVGIQPPMVKESNFIESYNQIIAHY